VGQGRPWVPASRTVPQAEQVIVSLFMGHSLSVQLGRRSAAVPPVRDRCGQGVGEVRRLVEREIDDDGMPFGLNARERHLHQDAVAASLYAHGTAR
jgi:hypothetical protein